jgi:hypothetical protein
MQTSYGRSNIEPHQQWASILRRFPTLLNFSQSKRRLLKYRANKKTGAEAPVMGLNHGYQGLLHTRGCR